MKDSEMNDCELMPFISKSPVWSCNEWDPLEEVVVGIVDGAIVPELDAAVNAITPEHAEWFFKKHGGKPFPQDMIQKAAEELDGLAKILIELGITVRRPEPMNFAEEYKTPWWKSRGLYAAMPRDVYMVIGDILVEAPMAWRSRYFESFAYHPMMHDYFNEGARWLVAPKPAMADGFYNHNYSPEEPLKNGEKQFVITNKEIAFDAADFVRCGKDIFVQKSNVTNGLGIEWVRRHIGSNYAVHEVEFGDMHPMHIDTTIVPLAPGRVLINPTWVNKLPPIFDSWEVFVAPEPTYLEDNALYFSSDWLTINTLSLDEKRVVVEEQEQPLIDALKKWGFEPVPIPFRNFYSFGGSVHCATLDIRRRGSLKSYF
ncbi:MAG TPA: amidinotransferase [Candidatus Paceibacterota bacterium]